MSTSHTAALRETTTGDAMSPGAVSCPPSASAAEVAAIMAVNRLHCVVVPELELPRGGRGWGLVSDAELIAAGMGDFDALTARDIADPEPITVAPDESLEHACRLMDEHGVSHLLVEDGSWPVGVLSSLDIARVMAVGMAGPHRPRQPQ